MANKTLLPDSEQPALLLKHHTFQTADRKQIVWLVKQLGFVGVASDKIRYLRPLGIVVIELNTWKQVDAEIRRLSPRHPDSRSLVAERYIPKPVTPQLWLRTPMPAVNSPDIVVGSKSQ